MRLIGNIMLALVAITLFVGLMPLALVFGIFRAAYKGRLYSFLNTFFFRIGYGIDQTGNGAYSELLNGLFKKDISDSDAFGNPDETVSSVLGRMQRDGKLSIGGWVLNLVLYIIDIKNITKGGHSLNSIEK